MKKITKEVLQESANKMMINLSEKELDLLLPEFELFEKQIALLDKVEGIEDASPLAYPFESNGNILREDKAKKEFSREELLSNSKDVVDGQIRLPKVVK